MAGGRQVLSLRPSYCAMSMQSSHGKQRRSAGTAHAGVKASGSTMQQVRVRRRNEIKPPRQIGWRTFVRD
jgi:hypothetical protein